MTSDVHAEGAGSSELLAVALGLSQEQAARLRELAAMHGADPVALVRDMVQGQLDLTQSGVPDGVVVTFRDFRAGSEYLSRLGHP